MAVLSGVPFLLQSFLSKWNEPDGDVPSERHAEWATEVQLEIVRAVAEREKRSLTANLIGWAACIIAALAMPGGEIFTAPIAWRLFSIFYVRYSWGRLREKLINYEPYEEELELAKFSAVVSGFFWGLLLLPLAIGAVWHPLALIILTVATIGVSLACTLYGPLPKLLFSYYAFFMITVISAATITQVSFDWWVPGFVAVAGCGIISYALGSGQEHRTSAETLVENRRLGYELKRALSRSKYLAERDPLTGLLNRRAFFDKVAKAERSGTAFLLAIDLDHFKRINDQFGHAVGDQVLEKTAEVINRLLKGLPGGQHLSVRLGGEEFAILLHRLDRATAVSTAEALRERIATIADLLRVDGLTVSASIGLAQYGENDTVEEALAGADRALYEAKNGGRNRVVADAA